MLSKLYWWLYWKIHQQERKEILNRLYQETH